jgi:hypothetical protein
MNVVGSRNRNQRRMDERILDLLVGVGPMAGCQRWLALTALRLRHRQLSLVVEGSPGRPRLVLDASRPPGRDLL